MGAYYTYQVVNDENKINFSTFSLEKKLRLEKYSVFYFFQKLFYNHPLFFLFRIPHQKKFPRLML